MAVFIRKDLILDSLEARKRDILEARENQGDSGSNFYMEAIAHGIEIAGKVVRSLAGVEIDNPAADVVAVVRCRDCKYNIANMKRDPLDITDYTDITCSYLMTDGIAAEDYCSRGERRADNG